MRKIFFISLLTSVTAQFVSAQNIVGTVRDEKGNPLHFVFVGNIHDKNVTYTDSLGNFTIAASPGTKLDVDLRGYETASITINKADDSPQVTLKSTGPGGSGKSVSTITGRDSTVERPNSIYLDRLPGHEKGKTKGNRYLFDIFAHGYFINTSGDLVYNRDYLFDYDKMGGGLLITKDGKSILELSFDQTKTFTLYSNTDEIYVFEKVPSIDVSHYLQVLGGGKKYKIYKFIKTTFRKSDYVNAGMIQHGNDFDEFIDDADYYLFDVQANQTKKFTLKRKSLKESFAKEGDKINKHLSDHSGDINDAYLSNLGDAMNQ